MLLEKKFKVQNSWAIEKASIRKEKLLSFVCNKLNRELKENPVTNVFDHSIIFRFVCDNVIITDKPSLSIAKVAFGSTFYKRIVMLQDFIKLLLPIIDKLNNVEIMRYCHVSDYNLYYSYINFFDSGFITDQFQALLSKKFSDDLSIFEQVLNLQKLLGLTIKFIPTENIDIFNQYLFLICVKGYTLEKMLRYYNWVVFCNKSKKDNYTFNIGEPILKFSEAVTKQGYASWHNEHFNLQARNTRVRNARVKQTVATKYFVKTKLMKKWSNWREFKRSLLFDKKHVIIKFKWLYNHKRILSKQFLFSYAITIRSTLKKLYNKRINSTKFFTLLSNVEYRVDILSKRIFYIKTLKWVWFLFFSVIWLSTLTKFVNFMH